MRNPIRQWITTHESEILNLRRALHRRPELSHCEFDTAACVRDFLGQHGVPVKENIAGTGLLTQVGNASGRVLAFRGDMDALQIQEETGLPYASQIPGVMHACGHDVHTTIIAGVNAWLQTVAGDLNGRIKCLYQPAEEADEGGAERVVSEGHIDDVTAMVGLHVDPALDVGKIGLKDGSMMASIDFFSVTIKGPGGHGARPHQTVDTVFVMSQVLNALYQLTGRYLSPLESPAVLSIGRISGGHQANVIPETCGFSGTFRALDDISRRRLQELVRSVVVNTCTMFGADFDIDLKSNAPPVINDPQLGEMVRKTVERTFGEAAVEVLDYPMMASEDFAFYREKCPIYFLRLGVRSGDDTGYPLHHPRFAVDERAIAVGIELLANFALDYFERGK